MSPAGDKMPVKSNEVTRKVKLDALTGRAVVTRHTKERS
jgi:hypothetical protein